MPQSPSREAAASNPDVKAAIEKIANSLQMINLLSTRLRQDLGESSQHAIDFEGRNGSGRSR